MSVTLDPVRALERTRKLIDDLRARPAEAAWIEFKENNAQGQLIGKLMSAMSNAARLADEHCAYIVWGIRDGDHAVVGTDFEPSAATEGNQPLEFWLAQRLQPSVAFEFEALEHDGHRVVLLTIPAAPGPPVSFDRTAYLRVGSATPCLVDYPERHQALLAKLQSFVWETGVAAQFLSSDDVLSRLDYADYFDLTGQPLPGNRQGIFEKLEADRLIQRDVGGHWNITNLGAILFAKRLDDFESGLARKAVRFVAYDGQGRASTVTKRQEGQKGYATGLQGLMDFIEGLLPRNERIESAFRKERPLYPTIALREVIANALIHQDMTIRGAGPMIELFTDRIEITDPGEPLVTPDRFLDATPRSRNEALAKLMRRMGLCEEQGTGIDKVITAVEAHQLPPPDFRMEGEAVRVVLFAPREFAQMTPDERLRACYQHAALQHENRQRMTNATLRARLGIDHPSQASVIIRHALDAGLIRAADPERPRAGYIPQWAS